MMKLVMLMFIVVLFVGCGKEKVKFEAFNPEAFAYDLGDGWEVNSSTNVRGFHQQSDEEEFTASISFSVDLETPSGEIISSIFETTEEKTHSEEMLDLQLNAQFDLDTSYVLGKYQLIYKIKDNFGGESTEISVELELSK